MAPQLPAPCRPIRPEQLPNSDDQVSVVVRRATTEPLTMEGLRYLGRYTADDSTGTPLFCERIVTSDAANVRLSTDDLTIAR